MPNSRNLVKAISAMALASALGFSLSALRIVGTGTAVATISSATVATTPSSAVAATPNQAAPNQNLSTTPSCESAPTSSINPNDLEAALIQLIAHRARLEAELGEAEQINLPSEFRGQENNELVMRAMGEEQQAFQTRKQQIASDLSKAQENIAELKDERSIAEAKKAIAERQAAMLHSQLDSVNDLLRRGLSTNAQKLAIEQNLAQYESARLDMQLLALKSQQEWMKTEQHVVDLRNQVKMADWVEFNQTKQKLAELSRQASALQSAGQRPEGPCGQEPENKRVARPQVTASNEVFSSRRNETTGPSATVVPPSPPVDRPAEPKRPYVQGRQGHDPRAPSAAPAPQVGSDAAGSGKVAEAPRIEADSTKPVRNNTKNTPPVTKETIPRLDDVVKRYPKDPNAYYRRGQVYAENGDYDHAVADFNEAIRLNPRDPEALNNRCWARAVLGQLPAAIADCSEALRLKPDYADALDSRGFANLKLGNYLQAIADFDGALKSNPRQVSSLYGRGRAKLKSGDEAGGSADIKSAKALDPNIAEEFAGYGVAQ
jgi:tetratricopeptide (TPR) repeat protein